MGKRMYEEKYSILMAFYCVCNAYACTVNPEEFSRPFQKVPELVEQLRACIQHF